MTNCRGISYPHEAEIPVLTNAAAGTEFELGGKDLTLQALAYAAGAPEQAIRLERHAEQRMQAGFDRLMQAANAGEKIYGLTVGVGLNKDRSLQDMRQGDAPVVDDGLLALSRDFNHMMLRSHAAGLGEDMPVPVVRAAMIIRLHTLAGGYSGAHPSVGRQLLAFLNAGITPVVPSRGSVGEADITLAAHIGLAMVGEWFVYYRGERFAAGRALAQAGLSPLQPVGKDFLAILGTNALTAARACLALQHVKEYLDRAVAIFALALEGFNGNIAPFLREATALRPYPGMTKAAERIRRHLDGSYLWQPHADRALQDPLSFRTMAYVLGNVFEAVADLETVLSIHINHGDDNPAVVAETESMQQSRRVCPTANFEMLPVAARLEQLNAALARLALAIASQTLRFETSELTGLRRFLAGEQNHGHAFGAIQKPVSALYADIRHHAVPSSLDTLPLAGSIEDMGTNASATVIGLETILDRLYELSSLQLLHAAQAADLRAESQLSRASRALVDAYREHVAFVAEDRIFTTDIQNGACFLRTSRFATP